MDGGDEASGLRRRGGGGGGGWLGGVSRSGVGLEGMGLS